MKKIVQKKLPKHYLIVDTTELFKQEKHDVVSDEFIQFWQDHGKKYEIELIIPEVVLGELRYQHTSTALTILNRINEKFKSLNSVSHSEYSHSTSQGKVKRDVEKKIHRWVSSVKARIEPTPINEIDWESIIHRSIWRIKPFTEDKKVEKGFRDSLILETVKAIVKRESNNDIAFITQDKLLRESVREELKKTSTFNSFESLEEFSTYLKLLEEKLTNEFVREIQKRARDKFYNSDTNKGLITLDVIEGIKEKHSEKFSMSQNLGTGLLGAFSEQQVNYWTPISPERIWIRVPSFIEKQGERKYVWASQVSFVQVFEYDQETPTTLLSTYQNGQKKYRVIPFDIIWEVDVKADGRFYKMRIIDISAKEKIFSIPSYDEIIQYELDSYFNNE